MNKSTESNIKFNWKDLGILFNVKNVAFKDFKSRTMLPKAIKLNNKTIRVFYTFINNKNNANCSFFDFDPDTLNIKFLNKKKILEIGKPGLFDDSGTLASCVLKHKNDFYLFYNGYKQTLLTPYSLNVGLAISKNCKNFKKYSDAPVLERNKFDPYFITGPGIYYEKSKFHCWYSSGMKWINNNGKYDSQYCIKHASSKDCIKWNYNNQICLTNSNQALASPNVFKYKGIYHMIFCYRLLNNFRNGDGSYRLGYAYSKNGLNWKRNDKKLNFPKPKKNSWNFLMQCYPNVIRHNNQLLLLYNGNGFGETGIGLMSLNLN